MKLPSSTIRCSAFTAVFLAVVATTSTTAAPEADEVVSYPGFGPPPTKHYSGYLDASDGCDTKKNGPECQLHYIIAMAEEAGVDSDSKSGEEDVAAPTLVWFNGGPGCSSLQGFFEESGPFTMAAKGGIIENPYSWTKAGVNFMALESPVGVGFSYCSNQIEKNESCYADDQSTAKMNKAALIDFYQLFPELKGGDLYISGESYAGVYIPTLTKELLDDPLAKDPTGILVGDPCIDNDIQELNLVDTLWKYPYDFGFMTPENYHVLQSNECSAVLEQLLLEQDSADDDGQTENNNNKEMRKKARIGGTGIPPGNRKLQMLHKSTSGHGAASFSPVSQNKRQRMLRTPVTKQNRGIGLSAALKKCVLALYEGSFGSSLYYGAGGLDAYGVFDPWIQGSSTSDVSPLEEYLSRDDVQSALHVEVAEVTDWKACGGDVVYTMQYNACGRGLYGNELEFPDISMINFYQEIAPKLTKTWIFSGDTDAVIPMEGTRDSVQAIGFPIVENRSYRAWYYNESAASIDFLAEKAQNFGTNLVASQLELAQFGGDVVNYEEGLSFVTVHGAGHMVGRGRPQQSLHMFKKFIEKDEELSMLSPPLPAVNASLEDDPKKFLKDFFKNFDWYETAQGPPYVQP